ncbi:VWA domain-containing protein [Oscillochloris sp. ZM17-4]|uniref:VWA domain-containing protein n=1 Tax=Oscillochloris sp. ZM17-4 TaxID=2866714 RepID=UPI001C7387B8|nr:VWA domain-containing protein [Oscillochloris sp. ZM17-4]MBX0327615.1 VWA domain-containing protein [Oscillochloris sp. ZM17-4]
MSTTRRPSLSRIVRQRKRGQSIPIIALMIIILVAMVGLSVDVGNTFSQERQAVSASNAASIAGMTAYIQRNANTTPGDIFTAITNSLQSNGINAAAGTENASEVAAYYLDSQGEVISRLDPSNSTFPDNIAYIQVTVDRKVDTSFARVVGRNDLPINASAHAGLCPVNSGVYPLAVDTATITGDTFNDDGIDPSDPDAYKVLDNGSIQRRIYVRDGSSAGSFSWLRWMRDQGANGLQATSLSELAASMTGEGNIAAGFEEAPWPAGQTPPEGYPEEPGTINAGDWIWGSPGWKENNAAKQASLSAAIDNHIFNSTFLILPIYSQMDGTGADVQVRVSRLGAFVITGQGNDSSKGPYFDMIFVGEPVRQYTACLVTPPPPGGTLELFGNVSFYPEYQIIPTEQKPIQYVVVLDSSGSMSANFNGQCNETNVIKQCANGPPGYPAVQQTGTGTDHWWKTESERRIYVAKKALERLVKLANMPGNPGYDNTRPDDKMAVVWFNSMVPSGNTKNFSSNPTSLIDFITTLNNGYGNYRSQGGTNGAGGLYRASLMYDAAPKTVAFGGKNVEYKRVVLFITDGVSNQFLKTNDSNLLGGQSSYTTYPTNGTCYNLGSNVIENAACQLTDPVKSPKVNGMDRPITQMITTSQDKLRNDTVQAEVFVIALSSIPSTGLRDGVPSSTNYYFAAEGLETYADGTTNVDTIIDTINERVELGDCIAGPSGTSTGTIPSNEFVNGTNGLSYPTVGEVTISDSVNTFTAPITAGTDGLLTYEFKGVPQGTYRMEAYLFYHHPLDPPNVMRMYSRIWSAGQAVSDFTVDVSPSTQGTSFVQRIEQPLTLKLSGDVCPTL